MKKIIAGQLMMWSNLICIVIGYFLYKQTGIESEFVTGLIGFCGMVGSCFNVFISITLQLRGYNDAKIIEL